MKMILIIFWIIYGEKAAIVGFSRALWPGNMPVLTPGITTAEGLDLVVDRRLNRRGKDLILDLGERQGRVAQLDKTPGEVTL